MSARGPYAASSARALDDLSEVGAPASELREVGEVGAATLARDADAPDLFRTADGYSVAVWYRPSLARAGETDARATVEISHGAEALDALDVPALDGFRVYSHAAVYSASYAEALTARPCDTCEVGA